MAKTNYTKVEEALANGMIKMSIDSLGKYAEVSKRVGDESGLIESLDILVEWDKQARLERRLLLLTLEQDVKLLLDEGVYQQAGISRADLIRILKQPKNIKKDDVPKLEAAKKVLEAYKQEYLKKHPLASNEEIVKAERKKHINKRFNVNDRWLPLK